MGLFEKFPVGRYVPGQTFVHRLDPRSKIIFVFIFVAAIFCANTTLILAVHALTALFVTRLSRISLYYFWQSMQGMLLLIVFLAIYQMFANHQGIPVWSWGRLIIYDEGMRQAVFIGLRLILLLFITSLLTLTTSPWELTAGLERMLRPLVLLRFPTGEFALMLTIAIRYIPIAAEEIDIMIKARKARGADFKSRNLLRRIKELLRLIPPLFIHSFRRAEQLSVAMESRCYRGEEGRTRRNTLKMGWRDALAGVIAFLLLTFSFV